MYAYKNYKLIFINNIFKFDIYPNKYWIPNNIYIWLRVQTTGLGRAGWTVVN